MSMVCLAIKIPYCAQTIAPTLAGLHVYGRTQAASKREGI